VSVVVAVQPLVRFIEVISGADAAIALDEAALLMAAQAHPGLDVDAQLSRLDEIAGGCSEPTLDGLRLHLFADLGFAGNRDEYYDPRNSLLHDVMDRRTGIPISLSVLMMEVGRRLGVPLWGIGMPGHFLVRDKVDPAVFVDPFERGALLDENGCQRRFHAVNGPGAGFDRSFLEPVERRMIVLRMLTNLETVYTSGGDRDGLAWVLAMKSVMPDRDSGEASKLARVLAAEGSYRTAADLLESLAALVPEDEAGRFRGPAARLRAKLN